jgi:UDP-N-acetylmuramate dehydrogenase
MSVPKETIQGLAKVPHLILIEHVPLSRYTRFGIGGPATLYVEAAGESSFMEALRLARESGTRYAVIGGGTNLVVSDDGFSGMLLRFTGRDISNHGGCLQVQAGADLQELVDYSVAHGLKGLETMTGIPGSTGGAVYGNAGAYGHSIMERIHGVRFFDGDTIQTIGNAQCEFHYRESIFKRRKEWVVLSAELHMDHAHADQLADTAAGILKIRNEKYPPTMKCAGSIFKNLILAELPQGVREQVPGKVVREGKVPSAWFLEEVGAKGLRRGDIQVATYHANLIYNDGRGTARDLRDIINMLKTRVQERFGFNLEEEVQYLGFESAGAAKS